jgi:pyruvate dehydrogenase E2 component (dihydrolipoamide acetyltransferase)
VAVTKVVMPKLSEAMETGKIIKWLKQEGDRIQGGDIVAEVETDKADVEMEAFGSGILRKIIVPAGGQVPVGALIGVIAEPSDDISAMIAEAASPSASESAAPAPTRPAEPETTPAGVPTSGGAPPAQPAPPRPAAPLVQPAPSRPAAPPVQPAPARPVLSPVQPAPPRPVLTPVPSPAPVGQVRIKASPLARKIAAQWGVDLAQVQGSGPGGRVVRRDVEAAAAAAPMPAAAGPTEAEFEDLALSPMRATIAKRMALAKAPVPHFYVSTEVAMDRVWALREELNALDGQAKISVNDLVVRACALALVKHPGINASFQGESIRVYHRAHLGIAVALDEGLITPVLRDCQAKSLTQIAVESRDLTERARARKLRALELSGATFSISNLGMYNVTEFSAIINPPEGAILAVGSVRRVPVVDEGGELTTGRRMMLTLSCDHRVMDGAMGARFLQELKRLLEEPLRLVA